MGAQRYMYHQYFLNTKLNISTHVAVLAGLCMSPGLISNIFMLQFQKVFTLDIAVRISKQVMLIIVILLAYLSMLQHRVTCQNFTLTGRRVWEAGMKLLN